MKVALLLVLFVSLLEAKISTSPKNFSQAKNLARVIYFDNKMSFYHNCSYYYDKTSCLSQTRIENCSDKKALHVKFERVIPASFFAKDRVCMRQKICINMKGIAYSGERCCRKSDAFYQKMDADVFNIVPVIDTYNGYMPKDRRGDVARVYLYYNSTYGMKLNDKERLKFFKWHQEDAVDKRECAVYTIEKKMQKHTNIWLDDACEKLK